MLPPRYAKVIEVHNKTGRIYRIEPVMEEMGDAEKRMPFVKEQCTLVPPNKSTTLRSGEVSMGTWMRIVKIEKVAIYDDKELVGECVVGDLLCSPVEKLVVHVVQGINGLEFHKKE